MSFIERKSFRKRERKKRYIRVSATPVDGQILGDTPRIVFGLTEETLSGVVTLPMRGTLPEGLQRYKKLKEKTASETPSSEK